MSNHLVLRSTARVTPIYTCYTCGYKQRGSGTDTIEKEELIDLHNYRLKPSLMPVGWISNGNSEYVCGDCFESQFN